MQLKEIAAGLLFPEGPVVMEDGSIVLVEIARGTLSRVTPNGRVHVIAELGGGPNGAAVGPDGAIYVCNNGGFTWREQDGLLLPGGQPADYSGGRIERVDPETGRFDILYTDCDGVDLKGPNDLVFDNEGGFYFSDLGKQRRFDMDIGRLYYAKADGSLIREVAAPLVTPNGVGLSPDGKTLYSAETQTGRLWRFAVDGPGRLRDLEGLRPGSLVVGLPGFQLFDSLAVEASGNICVATLINGGITVISPDGTSAEHVPFPDPVTTNIAFGGPDLRTAYVTLSGTGRLVSCEWPRPGLRLAYPRR
ncbi:MAG: SMP-30/gluconolactonase/LRE family protein [Alphaproteobacteria bacterium]|nr:SMP-30/gluconolactonase/LRE family protein [Alphaproteobacteria bacterium]